MKNTSATGQLGEDLACEYLKEGGYKVIDRNFRKPWGELDIIAKSKGGVLVFVEVKTIRQYGNAAIEIVPEDNLTSAKLKKLQRTAQMFVGKHPELINDDRGWQIDLIAITLLDDAEPKITHYENI
ncbi:MAG: YraN family protein [bacterium]|nr:YraN family protein [bacterium]